MKKNEEKVRRVERTLINAHRHRVTDSVNDIEFAHGVMVQVRRSGQAPECFRNGSETGLVWRFAFVSILLAVMVLAYSFGLDSTSIQYEIAQTIIEDPTPLILAETFTVL